MTLRLFLAALAVSSVSLVAHATTIDFSTAPYGPDFTGPVTESGYTYQTVSGFLFVDDYGETDPGQDLEGQEEGGGGVVEFTSTSGDFTFSQVDFAAIGETETITLTGLLDGAVVGIDTYTLPGQPDNSALPNVYTTELASNLSDVTLDELTIDLPASSGNRSGFAAIDNVVLNAVVTPTPEPSSLALLGTGLLGVMETLRRRRA